MAVGRASRRKPSAKHRLNLRYCKAARYQGTESVGEDGRKRPSRDIRWDTEIGGLGLRLHPNGRRCWVLRYRYLGKTVITRFAEFPDVLPDRTVE